MSARDHNTRRHWHARPADGPREIVRMIGDIEYTYNPHARDAESPFLYDPYGQPAYAPDPSPDAGDQIGEGPLFQGMRHDPEQAPFYDRPRAFHPQVQPWIQTDPVAYVDGVNWCNAPPDNPINAINPLGT